MNNLYLVAALLLHTVVGTWWGLRACRHQEKLYPDSSSARICAVTLINAYLWPLCMIIAFCRYGKL